MKTFLEQEIDRKLKIANHLAKLGSKQADFYYKISIDFSDYIHYIIKRLIIWKYFNEPENHQRTY